MAKIRHITCRVSDVEKMATLFVSTLDMTLPQRRKNGAIDLSEGSINITLLPKQ
jgi:hypothetical protein